MRNLIGRNKIFIIFSILVFVFFALMLSFWIGKGTYSLSSNGTNVSLTCPAAVSAGMEFSCQVSLDVSVGDSINGASVLYNLPDGVSFVSFTSAIPCADDATTCVVTSNSNGFLIANVANNYTSTTQLGTLRLKLASTAVANRTYTVGISGTLSNSNDEAIDIDGDSADVKASNNVATLSALSISTGSLNETFRSTTTSYTATVGKDVDKLTITATKTDSNAKLTGNVGQVNLHYGTNTFNIVVTAEDNASTTTYTLSIYRQYEFSTTVYTTVKQSNVTYIYTGSDTGDKITTNIDKLSNGLSYNINNGKLEVKYDNEVLASMTIINFSTEYTVLNKNFQVGELTYGEFKNKINVNGITYKVFNGSNTQVTSDSTVIGSNFTMKTYLGTALLDTYGFSPNYLSFDSSLVVDTNTKVIKRLVANTTYSTLKSKVHTGSGITVTSNDGKTVTDSSIVKTGDTITMSVNGQPVTYTLSVLGDVNKDGIVNLHDVTIIYRHYKKTKVITNDVILSAGDAVSNGAVDLHDVTKVYRKYKGTISVLS